MTIDRPVHPTVLLRPYDGPRNLAEQKELAALLAEARVGLPPEFCGDAGGILALMYRAIALDIPLMVAADNLVFGLRGHCAMRARLMKALVTVRAGHRLVPVTTTDTKAVVRLEYGDGRDPFTVEWTLATAQAAGLTAKDKSPWVVYSANMLYWRAMAKAVALGCPEATLGLGIVEAMDPDDPETDDAPTRPASIPETITITDTEGRPVPDGDVTLILNTIATREPDTGRPLVNDATSIDDLRQAWNEGNRTTGDGTARVLQRFAYADGDKHFTLEQVIGDLVEQVTARDLERAAVAAAEAAKNPPSTEALTTPAGSGGPLPCGCDAMLVATTGDHTSWCTR